MIIFIFTFESFFMRTGADWPAVTGHWTVSRRVGFKFFIFPYIYVCVYMAGGAKLPRHPSLDSLKPAGARVWLPALCAYMAGGSLDRPLPVARLSQAGCGSTLNPQPRERLRLEYILSRL